MPPKTTTRPAAATTHTDVVAAFSVDCRITATELSNLTDEQTRTLFDAITTVARLTKVARGELPPDAA